MAWRGAYTILRADSIARAKARWTVRQHPEAWIQLTFRDLPRKTEVLFLQGGG